MVWDICQRLQSLSMQSTKNFKLESKQRKYQEKKYSTSPLELVHTDLCGPTIIISSCGDRYFMLFIDDYYRMDWVTFIKEKWEAL